MKKCLRVDAFTEIKKKIKKIVSRRTHTYAINCHTHRHDTDIRCDYSAPQLFCGQQTICAHICDLNIRFKNDA